MKKIRFLFVMIFLASSLLVLGERATVAQSPTAIAIPTATAEGCDQVPDYLESRQKIMNELLTDMESIFPNVATPILENGDQLFGAMMTMTANQSIELAKAYDSVANKIDQIDPPAVAAFYNDLQVQLYRLSADVFEEMSTSDLTAAGDKFGDQLGAMGEAVGLAGTAATSVCPAFAEVVEFDKTQATI